MSDNYDPIIYSLTDEEGKEQQFEMIDVMEVDDQRYYAMVPYYENEKEIDEENDEFVILKEVHDDESENDEDVLLISVDDEDEYEKIGKMFMEKFNELFE